MNRLSNNTQRTIGLFSEQQKLNHVKPNLKGRGIEPSKNPLRPPFCRIGSKKRIRKKIYALFPSEPIDTYVEPFVGSGAIYWGKTPSKLEVLNDLDKNLMDNYKLLKQIKSRTFEKNIDTIREAQNFVNKSYSSDSGKLTKAILNSCNTFGSTGIGKIYQESNPYFKLKNIDKYQKRMENTILLNTDYKNVIKKYDGPNTFFFLDPPYENSKGLYENYEFNYNELSNILSSVKGKFLLTLNDSANIRNIFSRFNIKPIIVEKYHSKDIGHKERKELIIMNYNG